MPIFWRSRSQTQEVEPVTMPTPTSEHHTSAADEDLAKVGSPASSGIPTDSRSRALSVSLKPEPDVKGTDSISTIEPDRENASSPEGLHLGPDDLQMLMASIRLERQELADLRNTLQHERDDFFREREAQRQEEVTERDWLREDVVRRMRDLEQRLMARMNTESESLRSDCQKDREQSLGELREKISELQSHSERALRQHSKERSKLQTKIESTQAATEDRISTLERESKALKEQLQQAEQAIYDLAATVQHASESTDGQSRPRRDQAVASPSTKEQRSSSDLFNMDEHVMSHVPFKRYYDSCTYCSRSADWRKRHS